ncbi:YihY/virulence factor BrkB family protein [Catalinimonas niigatensis]|uniref:YihY/virulence factor BrkB family protein n=1 Tax=Catalinimonas niigatensis TaxID=1397264 RepID=UPI002665DDA9|nr:YihY/virulence factor BrkB family protein [Catalinimonas niigatensis]WPP51297.1 YihY/virulence factor BrkB family protein [Catalinimonas niigatensis]
MKKVFSYLKETYQEWINDEAFRQSAVIAYYSIFSIPGLIIIVVNVAGLFYEQAKIEGKISSQISEYIGSESAEQVQSIVANSTQEGNFTIAFIVGIATLIFGATGLFYQLQLSLNKVWEVELKPDSGIKKLVLDRATSLGLILAIGFLLIVSLLLSTALGILKGWISQVVPDFLMYIFIIANELLSIGIITVLFALIYKVLPDVYLTWKTVWVGAFVTALLFTLGKFALGFYFSQSDPASAFGAAGSLILILLWVNYSGLIFLFGAEFTQVYARKNNHPVKISSHAQRTADYKLKQERVTAGE